MKYFWRVIYILTAILGTLMVIGILSADPESSGERSASDLPQFNSPEQIGYFKADNNNRVFTFNIDRRMPEADIRSHANSRMHTGGRITYVFYYYGDAPNPTTASNLDRALKITEDSDFRYSFMKMGNGQSSFSSHK